MLLINSYVFLPPGYSRFMAQIMPMKTATAAAKSELVVTISYSTITNGMSDAIVATAMCG